MKYYGNIRILYTLLYKLMYRISYNLLYRSFIQYIHNTIICWVQGSSKASPIREPMLLFQEGWLFLTCGIVNTLSRIAKQPANSCTCPQPYPLLYSECQPRGVCTDLKFHIPSKRRKIPLQTPESSCRLFSMTFIFMSIWIPHFSLENPARGGRVALREYESWGQFLFLLRASCLLPPLKIYLT